MPSFDGSFLVYSKIHLVAFSSQDEKRSLYWSWKRGKERENKLA